MSTPSFRFKQFEVWHDQCAMKVGTDAVLLGAWCPLLPAALTPSATVLDIGTGSGIIALMLAQRIHQSSVHIDAIDMDANAFAQATKNFRLSPWSQQLFAQHCSLQQFVSGTRYALIVSNPPYFVDSLKNPDKGRELARHTDSLSYAELVQSAAAMLQDEGLLALILPSEAEATIMQLAAENDLSLYRLTRVYSKPGKPCKRILIALQKSTKKRAPEQDTLYIESDTAPRSSAYVALTQDFYL